MRIFFYRSTEGMNTQTFTQIWQILRSANTFGDEIKFQQTLCCFRFVQDLSLLLGEFSARLFTAPTFLVFIFVNNSLIAMKMYVAAVRSD